MAGKSSKIYHHREFNSKDFYDTYLSANTNPTLYDEIVRYPMRQLYKELSAGHLKGKVLVEFTPGPVLYKLLVCCEFFDEINVLEYNEECSVELKKWLNREPGAMDWSHVSQYACALEGKSTGWEEKDEKVRQRVKRVIDCDITADPIVAPGVLSPADCLICVWGLDLVSKDRDDYRKNLRKMASLVKDGGELALFCATNAKSYKVGEEKFHFMNYDEKFLRTTLRDEGLVIESMEKRPKADIADYISYDGFMYVRARKGCET